MQVIERTIEDKYIEIAIYDVLDELKFNQREKLKIDLEKLKDYFSRGIVFNKMIEIIKKSFEKWIKKKRVCMNLTKYARMKWNQCLLKL